MENIQSSRRSFIKTSALGAIGTITMPAILGGCSSSASKEEKLKEVVVPEILEKAPEGKALKAGLVGCGGRGTGAAGDFLKAGSGLQVTALGDIFKDRLDTCRESLKGKGQNIPDDKCFVGFDAYKQVIDSGVDVVLLCTPPAFRPLHFEYAIKAGKHCFYEKPCAVDSVGARLMLMMGRQATQKNLSVISGTIYRSSRDHIETYRRVAGGAIGDIISAHVSRMGGALWFKLREKGWDDMEYMMRNWYNFCWASGDFVTEQFIHEIDKMSWFMGDKPPVRAEATGGRQRRITGDIYDHMSIEFVYENGCRAHCTSRQIGGCDTQTVVMLYGTKGYTNCRSTIYNYDGTIAWEYPYPKSKDDPDQTWKVPDPFVQEHIRLVTAIRTGVPINDVEQQTLSTLLTIMGRESAYTGKFVTYEQIMASTQKLGPETYQFGPVPGFHEDIPLAGSAPKV